MLFKVLSADGRPSNGGSKRFKYSLPDGDTPGDWTHERKNPNCCASGWHLTAHPLSWRQAGAAQRLFIAEGRGAVDVNHDKCSYASVRLIREVTPEWELLRMFPEALVFLMQSWRDVNGPDAQWPDWASRADLSRADLSGANLSRADLSRADLSGADLSRADLSRANLSGANLSRADLSRADLYGANLSGANLSGANLYRADRPSWLPDTYDVDSRGVVILK